MAGAERQFAGKSLQKWTKLPMWVIEHVWAHRMLEIQQAVDASCWPALDSQPLTLDDPCRLRVASARVYSIVRIRDLERFEEVVTFLETTYRLLPSLVTPIKHMKILFGLKTLVIMRMLRERRGMIDIVLKTSQWFPSKLPQYQDQCSPHEMFLMRKSNLEFKALAQGLAMDKDKLEDYMKTRMEDQYGERYAQKVEERLLDYLHKLEAALPGDTYADKILKKQSPATEEEKLLLEVITADSAHITASLKNLLHCDVASCRPGGISQRSRSVLDDSSSSSSEVQKRPQTELDGEEVRRSSSSLHFCSKHQRWSRSILQECPDEPPPPSDFSSSPLLFPSSSSTASSQDLTPSDLVPPGPPGPPDRQAPPPQTPELSRSSPREPGGFSPPLFFTEHSVLRPGPPPCGGSTRPAQTSRGVQLRMSLPSQAVLLQSKLLQPHVVLNRLSDGVTGWGSSTGCLEPASSDDEEEEEEEEGSSFDVNCLYSSFSSSSGGEDSSNCDPEYKPRLKSFA